MTREQAEASVDAIFADLRDRRFLKWMFDEDAGPDDVILRDKYGEPLRPLALDVQAEIREAWISILMKPST